MHSIGQSAPQRATTAASGTLVLDPCHPAFTDVLSLSQTGSLLVALSNYIADTEGETLAALAPLQMDLLMEAAYALAREDTAMLREGDPAANFFPQSRGRQGLRVTFTHPGDPSRKAEHFDLENGNPLHFRRDLEHLLRSRWVDALMAATTQVATLFAKQANLRRPSSAMGVRTGMRKGAKANRLFRNSARLGFSLLKVNALVDNLYLSLDREVLRQVGMHFATLSWETYSRVMDHEGALLESQRTHGGMAPLYYPPAFYCSGRDATNANRSSPAHVRAFQQGMLSVLTGSPQTCAILRTKPPKYLSLAVSRVPFTPLDGNHTLQGLTKDTQRKRGELFGALLHRCATEGEGRLPVQTLWAHPALLPRILEAAGPVGGARAPSELNAAQVTLAHKLSRAVDMMLALPASTRKGVRLTTFISSAAMDCAELSSIAPSPECLHGFILNALRRYTDDANDRTPRTLVARCVRAFQASLPAFTFDGALWALEATALPLNGFHGRITLRRKTGLPVTCFLALRSVPPSEASPCGLQVYARDPCTYVRVNNKKIHVVASHREYRSNKRAALCTEFSRYLLAYRAALPLQATMFLGMAMPSGGPDDLVASPLSAARAFPLIRTATVLDNVEPLLSLLGRMSRPLAISASRKSVLDLALNSHNGAAVRTVCQAAANAGAPASYFERSVDLAISLHRADMLTPLLVSGICLSEKQETSVLAWHSSARTPAIMAGVCAARMHGSIREHRTALRLPSAATAIDAEVSALDIL